MKSRFLLAAALVALPCGSAALAKEHAAPAAGQVSAPRIDFVQWRLANGLRVIAIPDQSSANVLVSMWYGVGSKHDPEGRSGFAHLFEHILSRKTVNMPYNMINRLTEDVGGARNASTSDDRTNYYEVVPAEYLETLLWTHAERMARPVVDSEVFERERSIVKEELRQRVLAQPYGRLLALGLPENSFDAMPQRRSTIGSIAQLDSAKLDDARAFHQAFYGPDTATLIVSGNFEPARLRQLVDRYFAAIPARTRPVSLAITSKEPPRTSARRVDMTAPGVPLPMVGASWKLPGAASPDRPALVVLDAILSRGNNSRFYKALVRTGKSPQASLAIDFSREIGSAVPFAVVSPGQTPDSVLDTIYAEIERVRREPVAMEELLEAKNELLASALSRRETAQGRGFELGEALVLTGDPGAADRLLAGISRVTIKDVQRVAQKYLAPTARVELRYTQGADDPRTWANPAPMPTFASVDPAQGEPLKLREEKDRQAPPAPGAVPSVRQPEIAQFTLANGVSVVTAQTGKVPLATISVLLPGGAISDPRGKAGIAQFAANLATKGTSTRSAEQIAATMESLGASLGATAGAEGGQLTVTAPAANIAAAGEVLADILRDASYPDAEFQRERKRALEGLQVVLKDPGRLGGLALGPVVYGAAPYGNIPGGTPASLKSLTRDDLLAHRQTWWHPAATKVVISGGMDPAAARALAEKLFGGWTSSAPVPAAVTNRAGAESAPQTVVIDMPEAGQAAVYAAVRGTGRAQDDYVPLLLANAVLGSGSNGRLFEEVRVKRGLSYGAYSSLSTRAEAGLITASAQTKNESAADVAKIFLDEFDRLGREPISPDALQKRRLYLNGANQRSLETGSGFAGVAGSLIQQGLAPGEALQFGARLDGADAAAVNAAAARYVRSDRTSLVIVGNASQFIDKLKVLRPDLVVIKASDLDLANPAAAGK